MEFKTAFKNYMKYHKKYDVIICPTLTAYHAAKNCAYMLLTFVCDPHRVSYLDAWAKAADDLDYINGILSQHPSYLYSIGVIEPHINAAKTPPRYDGIFPNTENPQVEIERFFTELYPPQPGQAAKDALLKVYDEIQKYSTGLPPGSNPYEVLYQHYPSTQRNTHFGYPKYYIVLCTLADKVVTSRFLKAEDFETFATQHPQLPPHLVRKNKNGRFAQSYLKESNMENRHVNDSKILLFAIKNAIHLHHDNLIGRLSTKLYNVPVEIVSIFKALYLKHGIEVDYGNSDKEIEYKKIIIGAGVAPNDEYMPHLAPLSKTHNCILVILNFMRKYRIFFREDTSIFYKHTVGSHQTYHKYGDINTLLNAITSEYPDNIELMKQNSAYIKTCSKNKNSFFDTIIMSYKWIEYSTFCINLTAGIITPKDGRYSCFAYFPTVNYSDELWRCDSFPQTWLKLLMDVKLAGYDYDNVGRLKIIQPGVLHRLYELIVPRTETSMKNLSVNDEKVFGLLLTPFINLYTDVVKYDNLSNYDKDTVEDSQLTIIINPKLTRKFGIDKLCSSATTKTGTRIVTVDTITLSHYPSWAYTSTAFNSISVEDQRLHGNFIDVFDRLVVPDTLLNDMPVLEIQTDMEPETGSIILHLAQSYFMPFGGLKCFNTPEDIDRNIMDERATQYILQRNRGNFEAKTPSTYVKRTIPVLSQEELLILKEREEKKADTPSLSRNVTPEVPKVFDKMVSSTVWTSYDNSNTSNTSEDSGLSRGNQINIFAIRPELPIP